MCKYTFKIIFRSRTDLISLFISFLYCSYCSSWWGDRFKKA